MRCMILTALILLLAAGPLWPLDRPWISDVYFYWYTWDYEKELGGWMGGVYNTPLQGYYDSPSYEDNLASLHQASEWGLTHHFMDYWGQGWRDTEGNPREGVLMRAAEDLQKRGYDIFMSVYQDGTDFDMAEFSKNLDPDRDCEFYIKGYAKSPAYPKINGKPVSLIYGRNGRPKTTATDESLRAALKAKYATTDALNERWGSEFAGFDDIKLDFAAKGHQRAESIKHQYAVWAEEVAQTNRLANERFALPGCVFSWDIGYSPFRGYDYSDQARVFCGPHSYGGIFGVPESQDAERFIQAAVAKRYGTVFFDTFKNFYHDWEIRIPGTCYPPDFCAFDRFWVQALAHYSEALLHLSWNEWWEGSNLEPCLEFGKTYCEKNLLYASIMKQCFDSIHNWNAGAKVAVLLNDWHWLAGGKHPEDIYACIQALRRNNIRFDLLPDDFVSAEELGKFDVVLAPSGGVGFGYNAKDAPIAELLMRWAGAEAGRKLLIDDYPGLAKGLGLKVAPGTARTTEPGPNMNVYVDVGVEGDEAFLFEGMSGREDWGNLPPDKFGATDRKHTVRWTPASGLSTGFMLPFSPNRDHVLRINGSAIWDNHVAVLINGAAAAEFDLKPGKHTYEIALPAEAIGGIAFGELQLKYELANVPGERDPGKYGAEGRVCNLAIDWLQLATAGQGFSTEQNYKLPESGVKFGDNAPGGLANLNLTGPYVKHLRLAGTDNTLSTYTTDGAARDIEVGNILYVNGLFSGIEDEAYLDSLLGDWAGREGQMGGARAKDIIVTALSAGDTDILLAYNYAAPERRRYFVNPPQRAGAPPIVEIRVLSEDGEVAGRTDPVEEARALHAPGEFIRYYGVYQITHGRVGLETPPLSLAPGQRQRVELRLSGRFVGEGETATGQVRLISHIPSLTSDVAEFTVGHHESVTVPLTLTAREDIDWGEKTVIFDVEVGGRHSYFWRTLTVNRVPDIQVKNPVVDENTKQVTVASVGFPWAKDAAATDIRLTVGNGDPTPVGDLAPGQSRNATLPPDGIGGGAPQLNEHAAKLEYTVGGVQRSKEQTLAYVSYPGEFPKAQDAVAPMIVANPHDEYLENCIVATQLDTEMLGGKPAYVRERGGNVVPSQVVGNEHIYWIAMLPPKSATLYYLCAGEVEQPKTDLTVTEGEDGIVVSNSKFTLGWNGKQGGTVTEFTSHATGRQYAAGSFGAGFGTWGKFDPLHPRTNTVDFVGQEKKLWQRDSKAPAKVELGLRGPVIASVDVEITMEDGPKCSQRYVIEAYQSDFTVGSEVTAPRSEELVALDVRLARNELTKIFPNFTGVAAAFSEDKPTAGWREAPHIPPYATMMTPSEFKESISVIPWEARQMPGVSKFRQGFWPEHRPEAGPINIAQIEFVATDATHAEAGVRIVLHSGHQKMARLFRLRRVEQPPTIILPERFKWRVGAAVPRRAEDEALAPAPHEGWWSPYWHFAAPVTVGPLEKPGANPQVTFKPDFARLLGGRGEFDPASPRAVARSPRGIGELPTTYTAETGEVTVTLIDSAWPAPPPATREFTLYFDTRENGPKRMSVAAAEPRSERLLDGSLEEGGKHWQGSGGSLQEEGGRQDPGCAQLEWKKGMGPVVVMNSTMRVRPQSRYRVTFWAKTTSQDAAIRTNYYAGADLDFPQFAIPLTPDGEWHQYEQILPTGAFSAGVNPALRFWVLGTPQIVCLDDVEVEELEVTGKGRRPVIQVGKLKTQ